MDTHAYNYWSLVLWALTLIAGGATVFIYYRQLLKMDAGIKAQNLAWLVQYLQDKDVRHARFIVTNELAGKDLALWTSAEREAAATACAAYGVAAVYMKLKRIDKNVIIDNWGPSIKQICSICDKYIEEQQARLGPRYWSAPRWLVQEVIKREAANSDGHLSD
jgi:hypothetical protein